VQDNPSGDDCGTQPQPNDQHQEEQQADLRQSGRKRKLSPRAAEAAAAAVAQAAADPDGAAIAPELHAVATAGGADAAGILAGEPAECMSITRRNGAGTAAPKGKNKKQKTVMASGGDWSGCDVPEMSCGHVLRDADIPAQHAPPRCTGMTTRGQRSCFDHAGDPHLTSDAFTSLSVHMNLPVLFNVMSSKDHHRSIESGHMLMLLSITLQEQHSFNLDIVLSHKKHPPFRVQFCVAVAIKEVTGNRALVKDWLAELSNTT
jgi:hypothetical protein